MKKTIKAWAVWDGTEIISVGTEVISVGTGANKGSLQGLYLLYNDQKNLEEYWAPFKIIECTISYSPPTKKGKK